MNELETAYAELAQARKDNAEARAKWRVANDRYSPGREEYEAAAKEIDESELVVMLALDRIEYLKNMTYEGHLANNRRELAIIGELASALKPVSDPVDVNAELLAAADYLYGEIPGCSFNGAIERLKAAIAAAKGETHG
jgi:hypothetical protein